MAVITGLLLAAGAGARLGQPKALVSDAGGAWLIRSLRALVEGGCEDVVLVLGAAVVGPRELLREEHVGEAEVHVVVAEDWAEGQSASLRAGLLALEEGGADACVITLVDLPDVGPDVVQRVLSTGVDRTGMARAVYHGTPGHPVMLGRDHWPGVLASLAGDSGARSYLTTHSGEVSLVECGDLASGRDVDSLGAG